MANIGHEIVDLVGALLLAYAVIAFLAVFFFLRANRLARRNDETQRRRDMEAEQWRRLAREDEKRRKRSGRFRRKPQEAERKAAGRGARRR